MLFLSLLLSLPAAARAWTAAPSLLTDTAVSASMMNLQLAAADGNLTRYLAARNVSQSCTAENVAVRKDFTALSEAERLDFVTAMKCLMDAPGVTPTVRHLPRTHPPIDEIADYMIYPVRCWRCKVEV